MALNLISVSKRRVVNASAAGGVGLVVQSSTGLQKDVVDVIRTHLRLISTFEKFLVYELVAIVETEWMPRCNCQRLLVPVF